MADYIAQPDTAVDPDAPVTSDLMYALRDNPIAIAEGAPGAPRIADAALNSAVAGVTAAGSTWVGRRYAGLAWSAIGAVVMARGPAAQTLPGQVVSGGLLSPASAGGGTNPGEVLPGNWECMGYIPTAPANDSQRTTNWRRVS